MRGHRQFPERASPNHGSGRLTSPHPAELDHKARPGSRSSRQPRFLSPQSPGALPGRTRPVFDPAPAGPLSLRQTGRRSASWPRQHPAAAPAHHARPDARYAAEACVAGRHQAQQRGIFIQSVCPSRFPCGRWQCEQLPRGRSCSWIVRPIEAEPVPNCCDGVRGTWRGPGGLPGTFPRPRLSGSVAVPIAAAGIRLAAPVRSL